MPWGIMIQMGWTESTDLPFFLNPKLGKLIEIQTRSLSTMLGVGWCVHSRRAFQISSLVI